MTQENKPYNSVEEEHRVHLIFETTFANGSRIYEHKLCYIALSMRSAQAQLSNFRAQEIEASLKGSRYSSRYEIRTADVDSVISLHIK